MYLMKDVHGDTAYTLNTNGTKDAGYRYFAFGEQWSHSGSQDNPYRYCGEYIDNDFEKYKFEWKARQVYQ